MDHFENIIATLLEADGYWVRQSFKVNLTREEKVRIGKPSIPRPEIDVLALTLDRNEVLALEAKSFLDSPGVDLTELNQVNDEPTGRYKLFTCERYRTIVLDRLLLDLVAPGMATPKTRIRLGLAAGKTRSGHHDREDPNALTVLAPHESLATRTITRAPTWRPSYDLASGESLSSPIRRLAGNL